MYSSLSDQGVIFIPVSVVSGSCSTQLLHLQALPVGDPAATRSMPDAASALLAADYGSDGEEASIQGSAATAAEARDGSQSANGLPQGFFQVTTITPGERWYVLILMCGAIVVLCTCMLHQISV
jgi:type II secretory pathway component PulL